MKLHLAGGCGEHGRNCFLVEGNYTSFLVDCGVMAGEAGGGFPHLTPSQISSLRCVFLTHSHADHTGALPWLRGQGYTGPVIASQETLEQLPFHVEAGLPLEELCPDGSGRHQHIRIRWGRSGHCIGSVWYHLTLEHKSLLFSGDYTEDTLLHTVDPIRGQSADLAVLDCAYGHDDRAYEEVCGQLLRRVRELLDQRSTLLLPVPRYGRGLELLSLFAREQLPAHFYGDAHFLTQVQRAQADPFWYRAGTPLPSVASAEASALTGGVVFVSDPQLRTEAAQRLAERVLDCGGIAVMTGTVERGSFSEQLLQAGQMEQLRYPVHLNFRQYQALFQKNQFDVAIPYHTAELPPPITVLPL
jgi:glyoxylase-like metal-dependent hydrolase (beta-lactamase superfamily II)